MSLAAFIGGLGPTVAIEFGHCDVVYVRGFSSCALRAMRVRYTAAPCCAFLRLCDVLRFDDRGQRTKGVIISSIQPSGFSEPFPMKVTHEVRWPFRGW
jgi:hypothetical protein